MTEKIIDDKKNPQTFNKVVVRVRFVHFDKDWDGGDTHPLMV